MLSFTLITAKKDISQSETFGQWPANILNGISICLLIRVIFVYLTELRVSKGQVLYVLLLITIPWTPYEISA